MVSSSIASWIVQEGVKSPLSCSPGECLMVESLSSFPPRRHEGIEVPGAVRAVSFLHSLHPTDADADRLAQVLDEACGVSPKETRELLGLHFGNDEAA